MIERLGKALPRQKLRVLVSDDVEQQIQHDEAHRLVPEVFLLATQGSGQVVAGQIRQELEDLGSVVVVGEVADAKQ